MDWGDGGIAWRTLPRPTAPTPPSPHQPASLASSATAGWISAIVDNRTTGATDYELCSSPSHGQHGGGERQGHLCARGAGHAQRFCSAWVLADGAPRRCRPLARLPTLCRHHLDAQFPALVALAYTAADQIVQGVAMLSEAVGQSMPDGFALFVLNYSGAAFDASGQVIAQAIGNAVA